MLGPLARGAVAKMPKRRARSWRTRRLGCRSRLPADAAAAVRPGHDRDTDRGDDDLDDEFQPVDATGLRRDAERPCDECADERGNDADDDRQPDRDGLPARHDQPTEGADDGTDDDRFFFTGTAPTEIYTLSLHDALPI